MPQVEFKSVTLVFELAKTVHALTRAATVIDSVYSSAINNSSVVSCKHLQEILFRINAYFILYVFSIQSHLITVL
jgi:hypothetical protein